MVAATRRALARRPSTKSGWLVKPNEAHATPSASPGFTGRTANDHQQVAFATMSRASSPTTSRRYQSDYAPESDSWHTATARIAHAQHRAACVIGADIAGDSV